MVEAVQGPLHDRQQAMQRQHGQHEAEQKGRQCMVRPDQAGRGHGHQAGRGEITEAGQQPGDQQGAGQRHAENRAQLRRVPAVARQHRHEEMAQHPAEEQGLDHLRQIVGDQERVGQPRGAEQRGLHRLADESERPAEQGRQHDRGALAGDARLGSARGRAGHRHPRSLPVFAHVALCGRVELRSSRYSTCGVRGPARPCCFIRPRSSPAEIRIPGSDVPLPVPRYASTSCRP